MADCCGLSVGTPSAAHPDPSRTAIADIFPKQFTVGVYVSKKPRCGLGP